jgi:hypothetical protein
MDEKGIIVILYLHLNVNDYNALDFKPTGSSPFETKWRGSLYGRGEGEILGILVWDSRGRD